MGNPLTCLSPVASVRPIILESMPYYFSPLPHSLNDSKTIRPRSLDGLYLLMKLEKDSKQVKLGRVLLTNYLNL